MDHRGTFTVFGYLYLWEKNNSKNILTSYWLHFVGNRERGYYHRYSLPILKQTLYGFSTFSDLLFLYRLYWHRKQNQNDKFIQRTSAQKRLSEPFQKSIQRLMKKFNHIQEYSRESHKKVLPFAFGFWVC